MNSASQWQRQLADAAARGMVTSDSEVKYDRNNRPIVLYKRAALGGEHITNASSGVDQNTSRPQVSVTLDSEGGEIMSQTTRANIQKPDGNVVCRI